MIQLRQFSTEGVPAHRRVEYWNDITSSALTAQVADPVDRHAFCGRMTYLDVGEVRMLELNASGSTVTRTRAHVGDTTQPMYLMRLVLSGRITAIQDGREVRLRSGDFTLCDASRPYRMFFREPSDLLIARIPRERLLQYMRRPEAMVSLRMPGDTGLSGLASRQLRELWRANEDFVSHDAAPRMMELTMHLLASAYSTLPEARAEHGVLATAHRARIVELIERELGDPQLTPSKIAAELGMTSSYLHRVFSDDSETVARYILRRRLHECARALKDPLQANRSITAIAFALGFNSLSHFSRAFRERYDLSPSDYRHS